MKVVFESMLFPREYAANILCTNFFTHECPVTRLKNGGAGGELAIHAIPKSSGPNPEIFHTGRG